jgi:streptogramin lyase
VAHSLISISINSVGHLKNDGTHVGNVIVGSGPIGVSVDRNGKIWSANYYDGTLSCIDPNGGAVG